MTDEGVVVLGIPIPSSSPMFLSIVAVHVAAGLTCTVAGIVAMLAPKRSGRLGTHAPSAHSAAPQPATQTVPVSKNRLWAGRIMSTLGGSCKGNT
jgi:hypothetical protein